MGEQVSMVEDGALAQVDDVLRWRAKWTIEKRWGQWTGEDIDAGRAPAPYEVIEDEFNLLMYGGASCLWQCLIGNGTTTAGQALTYFNNAQSAIGVGDSTAAAAATQTNLQAATNRTRVGMDTGYPSHTDGTGSGAATLQARSTFGTSQGNYAWEEIGWFNSATDGTGRMLNRRVTAMGTKTSTASWTVTLSLTLA